MAEPKDLTHESYRARIDRVLAHIERAVAEGRGEVDLDALAEIACFSRFHFHRIYRGMVGETAAQTIRRLRLHRAAAALLESDRPVAEIAREAGYGGAEAFTRAFAAAYQAAPAAYRAASVEARLADVAAYVSFVQAPAYRLAAFAHRGAYLEIGGSFERLMIWAAGAGLFACDGARRPVMIGVYYDDPETTPTEELRSDAGVAAPEGFAPTPPARLVELPAGEHAVYRHVGPYAELHRSWERFYGDWLPQSGREPADTPSYEFYLNSPADTPPAELITEIRIPLKPEEAP